MRCFSDIHLIDAKKVRVIKDGGVFLIPIKAFSALTVLCMLNNGVSTKMFPGEHGYYLDVSDVVGFYEEHLPDSELLKPLQQMKMRLG